MSKPTAAVKNRYNAKAYDRIAIVVPKGLKRVIEAHAQEKGKSINGLVNTLLMKDMNLTEAEWKARDPAEE